jgi:hypothetical protein
MIDSSVKNKLALSGGGTGQQNRFVCVAGRKGSGKSSLTREILSHTARLFLFDTMGEHHWVPEQFDDLAEAQVFLWERAQHAGDFCASFISESAQAKALESDFSEVCITIYEVGNITFAVEEIPMLSQPQWVPEPFDRIVRLGRHRGINLLYTAQRIAECPRRLTAATDIFVLFRHTEPRDLDAIAERCGPEVASAVTELGEHEFIVFDVSLGALITIDQHWYELVLRPGVVYTPACDRNHGKMLWSLNDARG